MPDTAFPSDSIAAALPEAALVLCTQTDQILEINDHACRLLDLVRERLPPFVRFLGRQIGAFMVFMDEVDTRGEAWTRRVDLQRPNGAWVRCELRGRKVADRPGEVLLLIIDLDAMDRRAHVAEVAELQRAGLDEWKRAESFFSELERRNQLILNAAGEGIYGLNAEGKTTFVNRAAQEMLGWTTEDLLGKDIHSIIHHHHLSGEPYFHQDCPIYKSFRFEQVHRIEDEVFWRKDGKPIRVEYISTPIYDHQILAGAVVIFRDITDRKENEKKLKNALQQVADLRDRLEQENAYLQEEINSERAHHAIIGSSTATKQVLARVDLVAETDVTVMISGEPGTGKSLVAKEIHQGSPRRRRPLIQFNCSSVVPEAVEAELFGQLRGGPQAAKEDKPGKLELAHGGTLFLDEVEELPHDIQGKLLYALQTNTVTRLGDTRERPLDIRVISATTLSQGRASAADKLRESLFMHLNVFPITCLPLRDRPDDIPQLALHLLKLACQQLNRPVPKITERVMYQLQNYSWPGNVRELRNVIERAAILSTGSKLQIELSGSVSDSGPSLDNIKTEAELQAIVRANLISALRATKGKVSGATGAAALLDMRPTTVYSRIKSFGITSADWE
ncbi:PAS domain S-box protein [Epibacterium sp. SM1979]|uniref:Nif-specific regulatory protein n=1 Tax=Tritonibacter litoralis TaxID=2662264 RepID=A0A843YLL8_9RHOB|nr:sigma-54-dependent Fis family transcriptional regulator [Tritonibacter litoralis]MQQ10314.1 PAS domain S-box protein [Tritonibacter litoralis]